MTEHLYWHGPLWQVVAVGAAAMAVLAWLVWRALRTPAIRTALSTIDPVLDREAIFFFDGVHGVRPLNRAAEEMIAKTGSVVAGSAAPAPSDGARTDNRLLETLLEAYEGARVSRREGWPSSGQTLTATPLAGPDDVVTGVIALVSRERLIPPVMPTDGGGRPERDAWREIGPRLRLHRTRPVARVNRPAESDSGGSANWHEESLSQNEDRLLRHLLAHRGQVQPAETLFALVWADEEVDRLGLRPDQHDRLRRLVFQLRQRVEPDPGNPEHIETARGVGYVIYGEPDEASP